MVAGQLLFQFGDGGEDASGGFRPQRAEDWLGRVEFGVEGRQGPRRHVLRPRDGASMRAGALQDQADPLPGSFPPERLEEPPEPSLGDAGQQLNDPPGRRFHRRVQPRPLVVVVDQPARVPALAQPHPRAEPPIVKGPDSRGPGSLALAAKLQPTAPDVAQPAEDLAQILPALPSILGHQGQVERHEFTLLIAHVRRVRLAGWTWRFHPASLPSAEQAPEAVDVAIRIGGDAVQRHRHSSNHLARVRSPFVGCASHRSVLRQRPRSTGETGLPRCVAEIEA